MYAWSNKPSDNAKPAEDAIVAVTSSEFWDRVAPDYSRQAIADTETYARKLAATQALMQPSMAVLEFGCGTGSTALEHAGHVAQIDATQNDIAGLEPEGFPTIVFFPRNMKKGVEYDGSRDEHDLVQFIADARDGKQHIGGLPDFEPEEDDAKVEL